MSILRDIARTSARGGIYLFVGMTLATLINALSSILIGRLLGPDQYGLYSLAMTPASLLLLGTGLGISIGLTKFISESGRTGDWSKILTSINTGILFQFILTFFWGIILFIYSDWFSIYVINRPEASFYVRITSLLVIGSGLFRVLNSIFYGLERMDGSSLMSILQAISKFVLAVGLILLGYAVTGAIVGHVGSYLVAIFLGILILYLLILRKKKVENRLFSRDLAVNMVTYGFPAYLSSILVGVIGVYKNYLLAWFTTNIDIGNLAAALNLSTAITIFIFPVSTVLFPSFSKLDVEREINEVRELFRYAVRYSCILILPVSFFIMVLSRDVIFLFYGSVFRDAPLYLVIAALPYLLVGLGSVVLGSFFNGVGMTNIVFRMGVINLVASLPLYYLLIYFYGVLGILVALVLATFFMIFYGFWVARSRFGVWVDGYILLRIYFAAFLSGLAVYLLRLFVDFGRSLYNVPVFGVLFLFLYLVFLPLFRGIGEGDVDILSMAFSGLRYVSPLFEVFFELERRIIRFLQR